MKTVKYTLQNLDCANCAAKMEAKINALPDVMEASITFPTKQLRITAENPDSLLNKIQQICREIEREVSIVNAVPEATQSHAHCDHEHAPKNCCQDCCQPQNFHSHPKTAEKGLSVENLELIRLIFGAILFTFGIVMHNLLPESNNMPLYLIILFLVAYLVLGVDVLLSAAKGIAKKQVFNENFLMAVATIGAIVIGDYPEAVGVMLFFGIGELFEHRAVEKSRKAIMDAVDLRPETVFLLEHEVLTEVPAATAKIGNIIQVRPGDRIPLDGTIIDGESRIDTSPITGEPVPVHCKTGDSVISGCLNTSGLLTIRIEKELKDSMVSKILDAVENAAAGKPKIDRFITKFARIYTPIVVFSALAVAIIPSLITENWSDWIYTALTFLVISCPCALVLSVPLAFFSGIGAGSKNAILFKNGSSLEALNHLGAVIMDKTGTITLGTFTVTKIDAAKLSENDLLTMVASSEQSSSHPIAESILNEARKRSLTLITPKKVEEIAGQGISSIIENKEILCGKISLLTSKGIEISPNITNDFGTTVYCSIGGEYAGCITLSDTIKPGAFESIRQLRQNGLHTVMLTGDNSSSAEAVGQKLQIDEAFSGLLPADKLEKCKTTRENYGAVMFVGDGINDAPVLAGADVGAAMGNGADAAIDAADVVFMTSDMKAIPRSIKIAEQTLRIAKQNIIFALAIKSLVLVFGLFGIANMWFAVFADSGVAMLCVLNSIRMLSKY